MKQAPGRQNPQLTPRRTALLTAVVFLLLSALGCGHNEKAASFMSPYRAGNFARAADAAVSVSNSSNNQDRLLYLLEEAATLRAAGRFKESDQVFEKAYEKVQEMNGPDYISISQEMASAVLNPTVITYRGTSYDRVMLATYKALNALQLADYQGARVELTRAKFFQDDTQERFAKEIQKQRQAVSDAAYKTGKEQGGTYDVGRAAHSPEVRSQIDWQYDDMRHQFRPYSNYLNPFTQLLTGIFFLARAQDPSELEQARFCFRSVIGMVGENRYLKEDLSASESGGLEEGVTYLLVESGLAPWRDQFKITIPAFTTNMPAIAVSFPILRQSASGPSNVTAIAGGQSYPSVEVCSMDSIICREFDDTIDTVIFRTIAGTGTKAAITFAINHSLKDQSDTIRIIGLLGTSLYAYASNNADQRTWLTLPKRFYYSRFPTPEDRVVRLTGIPGGATVTLPEAKVNVIYVKAVTDTARPAVWQFVLK